MSETQITEEGESTQREWHLDSVMNYAESSSTDSWFKWTSSLNAFLQTTSAKKYLNNNLNETTPHKEAGTKWKERAWRGEQATSKVSKQIPKSLCVSSFWEYKKRGWHLTKAESKWASKISPSSPLICCLFLLPSSKKRDVKKQREQKKGKEAEVKPFTRGSDCF